MKSKTFPVILTAVITSLATVFVTGKFVSGPDTIVQTEREAPATPVSYAGYGSTRISSATPVDFQEAAEASVKAVVHIKTTKNARTVVAKDPRAQLFGEDMFGDLFGRRQYYIPPQAGAGSGVVISPDGYIVTNNHVIAGTDAVTVTFQDRYTTQARVVGTDPSTDIAILKVEENDLPFVEFGNSDDVRLGQWVLAVGYPLTLDATVTAGIVSAKARTLGINRTQSAHAIESFIQTDAAVNPGNSGGALVNTQGELIGINSAIASPTGSYAGYSYAIPSNIVRKVTGDLMKYGSVQRAYLGIEYKERKHLTKEEIAGAGIDRSEGIYVGNVVSGGAADRAGIRQGDLITQINGTAVRTGAELQEQLTRYKPGDHINITYVRSGKPTVTSIELRNLEGTTSIIKHDASSNILGASFRALTAEEKKKLGTGHGVVLTDPGSGLIATQGNIRKGFVVTHINEKAVRTIEDLRNEILGGNPNLQIAGFYPGQKGRYYYGLNNMQGER